MNEALGGRVIAADLRNDIIMTEINCQYVPGLGYVNHSDFYNDKTGYGTVKESTKLDDKDALCTEVVFTDLEKTHIDPQVEYIDADGAREIVRRAIDALDL